MLKYFKNKLNFLLEDITQIPDILQVKHLPSLNGLRAFSILYVLGAHFGFCIQNKYMNYVFGFGRLGVYVFFVISGFLITTLLLKEKITYGKISLKKFYLRRFIRIMPVAYLYLIILFMLCLIFKVSISSREFIGAALFLMNYDYFHHGTWLAGHYWSLSVEEQFYILFPFLLKANYKVYICFLICFLSIILLLKTFGRFYFFSPELKHFLLYNECINYFDGIIIGSLLAILIFKNLINFSFFTKYKLLLHMVCVPLLIIIFESHLPYFLVRLLFGFKTTLCAIIISILLISNLTTSNDKIFKLLNSKLMNTLGVMSYSIYIFNMMFTCNNFVPYTKAFPTYHFPIWLNFVLLISIAYLSYNFFEQPILKLKKRFEQY